jgi:hypothetical protein
MEDGLFSLPDNLSGYEPKIGGKWPTFSGQNYKPWKASIVQGFKDLGCEEMLNEPLKSFLKKKIEEARTDLLDDLLDVKGAESAKTYFLANPERLRMELLKGKHHWMRIHQNYLFLLRSALQEPVRTLVEKGDTVFEIVNLLDNAYAIKNKGEKGELLAKIYSISWKKGELFVEYLNRLQRVADKLKADHSHEIKEAEIIQRVKSDRGIMHDPAYGR